MFSFNFDRNSNVGTITLVQWVDSERHAENRFSVLILPGQLPYLSSHPLLILVTMNVGSHHSISISLHQTQIKGHELRYNYVNMFIVTNILVWQQPKTLCNLPSWTKHLYWKIIHKAVTLREHLFIMGVNNHLNLHKSHTVICTTQLHYSCHAVHFHFKPNIRFWTIHLRRS